MIWDMSESTFTQLHVFLSLVGIASGLVALCELVAGKRLPGWTALFLITTVLTSVTGFGFPVEHLLPSHKVGIASLVVLAVAIVARYGPNLAGPWRAIYVVTAALGLYFNAFVGVVQAFLKIPALTALAPNQTEAPFVIAQLLVLLLVAVLTILALKRFRA